MIGARGNPMPAETLRTLDAWRMKGAFDKRGRRRQPKTGIALDLSRIFALREAALSGPNRQARRRAHSVPAMSTRLIYSIEALSKGFYPLARKGLQVCPTRE